MHTIFESKRVRVVERDGWEYVERISAKEAVAVIAMTEDDRLVLVEQFRKPVNARVIDFPAGLVGDEEGTSDPAATAKKELEEEAGFACRTVAFLAKGPSSPGITSELVSLYRASGLQRKGEGGGVGSESITVHLVPRREIREWLANQDALVDLKVWSGLYFLDRE